MKPWLTKPCTFIDARSSSGPMSTAPARDENSANDNDSAIAPSARFRACGSRIAPSIELAFTEADRTGLDCTQKHHLPRLHRRIARATDVRARSCHAAERSWLSAPARA